MAEKIRVLLFQDEAAGSDSSLMFLEQEEQELQIETARSVSEVMQKIMGSDFDVIISRTTTLENTATSLHEYFKDSGNDIPFLFINDSGNGVSSKLFTYFRTSCVLDRNQLDRENVLDNLRKLSEKHIARETLKSSPELLDAIFLSVSDSIIVTDLEGNLVKVSRATLEHHGYTDEEEMIGRSSLILIDERDREAAIHNMEVTLKDGRVNDKEYRLVRKDGSCYYGELTANVIRDKMGKPIGFIAITKDITERKKSQEQIQWLYDAVQSVLSGIATIDRTGHITFANEALFRMWGYNRDELSGKEISLLFEEESRAKVIKRVQIEKPLEGWQDESIAIRKDGTFFNVMCYVAPLCDGCGKVSGYFISFIDISSERRLQRELSQKVKDLEAFGHIVAHDLKTPLISIMEFSRLLSEQVTDRLSNDEKDIMNRIVSCSGETIQMIEDLRKYYFLDHEEDKYEEIDISLIFSQVFSALEGKDMLSLAEIKIDPDMPPVITGRPTVMYHILYNLIENAVKFGGAQVSVSYRQVSGFHRFSIKDNGWGIEPYFHAKIFDIFSRSPKARKKSHGTGIGLAIVKRLVEKHRGRIWFESSEENGSTFTFELPVVPC